MRIPPGSQLFPRSGLPFLLTFCLVLSGCQEELRPVARPTASVSGRILLGEQPIEAGWVEFLPVDGTVGNLRSARLGPDGSFQAEGVAVGTNALRVVGVPLPASLYDLFSQRYVLRRTMPEAGRRDLDIDLLEESLPFLR